ncbi:MAG: trimethylamine methyltransferase family protein [Chloroflexi bacterium]|nr:trimethylamine methyltransferase family protein [Chloroflexota bacterium]
METALRVLSDAELIQVHERSMSVLATTGVRVDSAKARKILKSAGADVDNKTKIVRFPRSIIEEALRIAPTKFSLGGRRPGWEFKVNDGKCTLLADGAATYVIDGLTGDRRVAGFTDWLDATRMIDSLDEIGVYWSMVEPTFAADSIGNFVMYWRNMVRNFSKHIQDVTHTPEETRWMLEVLGTVYGGRDEVCRTHPMSFLLTPASPLVLEGPHTDAFLETVGWGIPAAIMPMPMMGGTAPATLISTLLVANCETLAMLCLVQAAAPGTPIIYAPCPSIMDPHTGRFTGSEVEHGLLGAAVTEMARFYKLPVEASAGSSGHYIPGVRTSYERAMNWAVSILAWPDLLVGPGQLGGSMFLSYEQLLIDVEIFRRSDRLSDGINTGTEEWLEVDLAAVGPGGNFLSRKSTRKALRSGEVYISDFYDIRTYEAWQASGKPSLLQELNEWAREILSTYQPLPLDPEVEKELEKIEQRARKET